MPHENRWLILFSQLRSKPTYRKTTFLARKFVAKMRSSDWGWKFGRNGEGPPAPNGVVAFFLLTNLYLFLTAPLKQKIPTSSQVPSPQKISSSQQTLLSPSLELDLPIELQEIEYSFEDDDESMCFDN